WWSLFDSLIGRTFRFFFFQAEDGIRDATVTGVQTCALPILRKYPLARRERVLPHRRDERLDAPRTVDRHELRSDLVGRGVERDQIGRASCRERVERAVAAG